jgi:hypothetical protein
VIYELVSQNLLLHQFVGVLCFLSILGSFALLFISAAISWLYSWLHDGTHEIPNLWCRLLVFDHHPHWHTTNYFSHGTDSVLAVRFALGPPVTVFTLCVLDQQPWLLLVAAGVALTLWTTRALLRLKRRIDDAERR